MRRAPEHFAKNCLRSAAQAVDIGGVEEGDAGIERRVRRCRAPPQVETDAEIIAAESERGHADIRRAERAITHGAPSPSTRLRIAAEDQVACRRIDRCSAHAGDAIQVAHVERIVAAEQHAVGAGFLIEEFERPTFE